MPRLTNEGVWLEVEYQVRTLLANKLGNGYILTMRGIRMERKVLDTLFSGYLALMNSIMLDGTVASHHTRDDLDVAYALLMDEANRLITQAA